MKHNMYRLFTLLLLVLDV